LANSRIEGDIQSLLKEFNPGQASMAEQDFNEINSRFAPSRGAGGYASSKQITRSVNKLGSERAPSEEPTSAGIKIK